MTTIFAACKLEPNYISYAYVEIKYAYVVKGQDFKVKRIFKFDKFEDD